MNNNNQEVQFWNPKKMEDGNFILPPTARLAATRSGKIRRRKPIFAADGSGGPPEEEDEDDEAMKAEAGWGLACFFNVPVIYIQKKRKGEKKLEGKKSLIIASFKFLVLLFYFIIS